MIISLAARHRQEWKESCVSDEIINRNVQTIEDSRELDSLLNRNTKKRWKHSDHLVPGWGVSGVYPDTGQPTLASFQFKPDTPQKDPKTGKTRKYFSPSQQALTPLFLEMDDADYWQKVKDDKSREIAICEGAKKAGCLLTLGVAAISIPGVSTAAKLGRLKPEILHFCEYGRRFLICFDRDVVHKPQVRKALHRLASQLAATGAVVSVMVWNETYKGIDDAIAGGLRLRDIQSQTLTIEEWKDQADRDDETNEPEKCTLAKRFERVEKALKDKLRWNALKWKIEVDGEAIDLNQLRLELALRHNIQLPSDDCTQICLYLSQRNKYNPVAEYLKECGKKFKRDDEYLDSLSETFLGASEPLHRAFLRKALVSAVARALDPGCKVDTVCILQGPQGSGKSSFWRILAGDKWFNDSVSYELNKDERIKLHKFWILEWPELDAIFRKKDVSAVKAFITTQVDNLRPPYGREDVDLERPSIIVGSTNENEFLSDPTGNRRYWVIPSTIRSIPLDKLQRERDRIWGAAYHAYQSGERWVLPQEMMMVAQADASNYIFSDPWEAPINDYCQGRNMVTSTEVLANALFLDIKAMDKKAELRVTAILKSGGWAASRRSVNGKRARYWVSPSFSKSNSPDCPKEDESTMGRAGQPHGQPPAQPHGQPPAQQSLDLDSSDGNAQPAQPAQPGQPFPRSSRSEDRTLSPLRSSLSKPDAFEPVGYGDLVEIVGGSLSGRRGYVVGWRPDTPPNGECELFSEGWAVNPILDRSHLRIVSRQAMSDELRQKADEAMLLSQGIPLKTKNLPSLQKES